MKLPFQFQRKCLEFWAAVALFGTACGAVGAYAWDGAQPLPLHAICEQIGRPVNPITAMVEGMNAALQIEAALRRRMGEDSEEGRTARLALYRIEQGAKQ